MIGVKHRSMLMKCSQGPGQNLKVLVYIIGYLWRNLLLVGLPGSYPCVWYLTAVEENSDVINYAIGWTVFTGITTGQDG